MNAVLQRLDLGVLRTLVVSLSVAIAVALFSYTVWPQIKHFRAQSETGAELQEIVSSDTDVSGELVRREQEIESLSKRLHGDTANMPRQQLESHIIGKLQSISWRTKMQLIGVRPSDGRVYKNYRELLFDVDLAGSYQDLFDWLERVSNDLGFIVVKDYDIAPVGLMERDQLRIKVDDCLLQGGIDMRYRGLLLTGFVMAVVSPWGCASAEEYALRYDPFQVPPASVTTSSDSAAQKALLSTPLAPAFKLTGTIVSRNPAAKIGEDILSVGDEKDGYRIQSIGEGSVVVAKDGKTFTLNLDESRDNEKK